MGSITLLVEGSTVGHKAQGGGVEIVKTVSEQDSGRLIQAYAVSYAGKWKAEDGVTNRAPTIQEVLQAWFDGVVSGSVAHVLSVEKDVAAKSAAAAVAQISVT